MSLQNKILIVPMPPVRITLSVGICLHEIEHRNKAKSEQIEMCKREPFFCFFKFVLFIFQRSFADVRPFVNFCVGV